MRVENVAVVRVAPRYRAQDAVIYVLTLCAITLIASLYEGLALERVLGVQFVVGWFSLDLCWSPASKFVRVDTLREYAAFAASAAAGLGLWWWLGGEESFVYVHAVLAVVLAFYWIFTETPVARVWDRGCVRALMLYGTVSVLAGIVVLARDLRFTIHPWFVSFVLNALATTDRNVGLADRALHGYTWGVLLEALSRDQLFFDKFFYD